MPLIIPERRRSKRPISLKRRRRRFFLAACAICIAVIALIILLVIALPKSPKKEADSISSADDTPAGSQNTENLSESVSAKSPYSSITVCLDPGHGFSDNGLTHTYLHGTNEKELNLTIALLVRELLQEQGFQVVMTREENSLPNADEQLPFSLTAEDRSAISNDSGANLFISLHCSSYPSDPNKSGIKIYYYEAGSEHSKLASQMLSLACTDSNGSAPELTVQSENTVSGILKDIHAPALLLELGCISSMKDASNLITASYQHSLAQNIADGICRFFDRHSIS